MPLLRELLAALDRAPTSALLHAAGELGDPRAIPALVRVVEQGPLFDVACQPPCLLFAGCWALPATCGVAVGKIVRQADAGRD